MDHRWWRRTGHDVSRPGPGVPPTVHLHRRRWVDPDHGQDEDLGDDRPGDHDQADAT